MNKGKTPPKSSHGGGKSRKLVWRKKTLFLPEQKVKGEEDAAKPSACEVVGKEGKIKEERKEKDAEKGKEGVGKAGAKAKKEQS